MLLFDIPGPSLVFRVRKVIIAINLGAKLQYLIARVPEQLPQISPHARQMTETGNSISIGCKLSDILAKNI